MSSVDPRLWNGAVREVPIAQAPVFDTQHKSYCVEQK